MKTDSLGQYDENDIPVNLKLPLKVDRLNDALAGDDGQIIGRVSFSSEMVQRMFDMRRADFVARLANGEIVISLGRVLHKVFEQWQEDRLLITYLPNDKLTQNEYEKLSQKVDMVESESMSGFSIGLMKKSDARKFKTLSKRLNKFIDKMKEKYKSDSVNQNGDK